MTSSSINCHKFDTYLLLYIFFHSHPKHSIVYQLKKVLFKSFFGFCSVPCSCLCRASEMLLDWTQISCVLFLALVHNPVPASLQNFNVYYKVFLVIEITHKFLSLINIQSYEILSLINISFLGYSTSSSSMYPLSPCYYVY